MDINNSIPAVLQPVAETMQSFLDTVQLLVGGLFGLYLLLVILKWRETRQLRKLMAEIRDELRKLQRALKPKRKSK